MLQLTQDEDPILLQLSELLETMDDVMSTLSLMLGGIAGHLAARRGIGIMNIADRSVAERTRAKSASAKPSGARRTTS